MSPPLFAFGSGARFVARAIDTAQKQLIEVMKCARGHKGASFVEIFQNCIVYNDDVFGDFTAKEFAPERQIHVEHNKPLLFGRDRRQGLRLRPKTLELEVVTIGENGVGEEDILVHDETSRTLATMLAAMTPPAMPVALGVIYCNPAESFEKMVLAPMSEGPMSGGEPPSAASLNALLRRGHTWTVTD